MQPIKFPESNGTLGRPKDTTEEQCNDLHVWRGTVPVDEAGTRWPVIISAWQLSHEDLEKVKATGIIYLSVTGLTMPPVSLFTDNILEGVDNSVSTEEQQKMYFMQRSTKRILCFPDECKLTGNGIKAADIFNVIQEIPFSDLNTTTENEYNLYKQRKNN